MFLKLDFSKAYDKVSWRFFFHAMGMIGISEQYIRWIQLLFRNATSTVNLNGNPSETFNIERGVRQGCPLAPYVCFFVGEALTHMVKKNSYGGKN